MRVNSLFLVLRWIMLAPDEHRRLRVVVTWSRIPVRVCASPRCVSPMNIIVGLDVPKDARTNDENSPNSVRAGRRFRLEWPTLTDCRGPDAASIRSLRPRPQRGCILAGDEEIAIRPKTFEFLRYLVSNPGRLVSKDELLAAVWPNVIVSEDSLVQCVTELRRALQDHDQHLIKTVQRRGYRFEAAVSAESPAAVPQAADAPTRSATDEIAPTRHDRRKIGRPRHAMMLIAIGALRHAHLRRSERLGGGSKQAILSRHRRHSLSWSCPSTMSAATRIRIISPRA